MRGAYNTMAIVFHFDGSVNDYQALANDAVRFDSLLGAGFFDQDRHFSGQIG